MNNDPVLRSWLFVPGDNEKMLGKSPSLGADALVYDLEDAVVESRKAEARQMVSEHLKRADRSACQHWVRINALDTVHVMEDLRAVMAGQPDGIFLPKAEHAKDSHFLADRISEFEVEYGITGGSTRIVMVAIETAKAILTINSYTEVDPRVTGLSWGAVDLSASIGAISNTDEHGNLTEPYTLARTLTLIASGASQVQAIDTAFLDFRDEDGLRQNCLAARRDGFLGKIAIHPAQVGSINEVFMPTADEIEHARAVVQVFADKPEAGSVNLNGKMLDKPHLIQAERTLSLARQYGE